MALATDPPFQTQSSPETSPVTLRAVILGLITIVVSTLYMDHFAGNLVKSYLPVAVLIPFLAWVVLNTLLRLTIPRAALSHSEILTLLGGGKHARRRMGTAFRQSDAGSRFLRVSRKPGSRGHYPAAPEMALPGAFD